MCCRVVSGQLRTAAAVRCWGAKLEDTHRWLRNLEETSLSAMSMRKMERVSKQDANQGQTDPGIPDDGYFTNMRETLFKNVPPDAVDGARRCVAHVIEERFLTWLLNYLIGTVVKQRVECRSVLWHLTYFALKISSAALRDPDVRSVTIGQAQAALAEYDKHITTGYGKHAADAMLPEQHCEERLPAATAAATVEGAICEKPADIPIRVDHSRVPNGILVPIRKLMGKQIDKFETPRPAYRLNRPPQAHNSGDDGKVVDPDSDHGPSHPQVEQNEVEVEEGDQEEEEQEADEEEKDEEDDQEGHVSAEEGVSDEAAGLRNDRHFQGKVPTHPLTAWVYRHQLKYLTRFLPPGSSLCEDAPLLGRMVLPRGAKLIDAAETDRVDTSVNLSELEQRKLTESQIRPNLSRWAVSSESDRLHYSRSERKSTAQR
jgi:hypothetical protein